MTETLLKIDDLKSDLNLGELGDQFCDYSGHYYICDVISEIANNNVDIYTYDLLKWLPDNYEWVEEAIVQGLCDISKPDVPRMIMAGQYECYLSDLYNYLDDSIMNYCLNYIKYDLKINEIDSDKFDELVEKCTNVDNNDTLDVFKDFINELFKINEDEEV